VQAALAGRNVKLGLVGIQQQANFVVIFKRRKSEYGRQFRYHFAFQSRAGTEKLRPRHIAREHKRKFALFHEPLDERFAKPGRNIPVNGADIVTGRVFPHFRELHALAFEHAEILARKGFGNQFAGGNLNLSYAF